MKVINSQYYNFHHAGELAHDPHKPWHVVDSIGRVVSKKQTEPEARAITSILNIRRERNQTLVLEGVGNE